MGIAPTTAAVSGLKYGKEILSGLLDAKIDAESRVKVTEALTKLGTAQESLFDDAFHNLRYTGNVGLRG